ncbi:hypothetical protein WMF45_31455 [Sorangium sp. So ce448]|uniref:hypothetical protein n=1 Tax=Sorangium sp. So ce448 TaxID=3133314 RepID=UPI003F5D5DB6
MKPSNLLCRQLAASAAAKGGGTPLVIAAYGSDGSPEPLRTCDDATGEPVLWGVHCVNEEPGGRIVDYAQGLVFDDRRQLVAALFDNARVVVEQEDLDW